MAHRKGVQYDQQFLNFSEKTKKTRQAPLHLFLLSLASCTLVFVTLFFTNLLSTSSLSLLYCLKNEKMYTEAHGNLPSSPVTNRNIWCDRTDYHSDICFMSGDVRTHSPSSSILLYPSSFVRSKIVVKEERIRPYTRKWESPLMKTIDEISLRTTTPKDWSHHKCDIPHDVPALVFSAAGYTGNIFHSFNNGILPLYITSQHLNRRLVLVVLRYREWWYTKYKEILSQLSDYPIVDFSNDTRTHCFPGAIVGLRFHETLSVNPRRLRDHKNITDFQNLLAKAYEPNRKIKDDSNTKKNRTRKLVIVSRKGTREIENEGDVVQVSKELGFDVEVLKPNETMPLKHIYDTLSTCDVAMGMHGSALTHFLFMQPGSTLIQIAPLGIEDLAWNCFGKAALKMGIRYIGYKVDPRESSLYNKYGASNPIVTNPNAVRMEKGWEHIKEVYLEGQNVTLNLSRVRKVLVQAIRVLSTSQYSP